MRETAFIRINTPFIMEVLASYYLSSKLPCMVARTEACPLGMQVAPNSNPMFGTFFHRDLVMKKIVKPFCLFRRFKKSSCQLLAKECALVLVNCLGGLPRNSVVRVTGLGRNDLKCVEGP